MAIDLAFRELGEGPPLVVLHGLFGSARNWTSVAKKLAESWKVYAVDLRNHGDSPWSEEMSYPAMAADILNFLDARKIDRVNLLGHSMGGKAAMVTALTRKQRIGSLIIVDIAPAPSGSGLASYVDAMRSIDLVGISRRAEVEARLEPFVPDPNVRRFLTQNLITAGDGYEWRLNLAALAIQMSNLSGFPAEMLNQVYEGPTLFLGGGFSDYIRSEHHALIRRLFPNSDIEIVPNAGHWVHAEAPENFTRCVQAFLQRADGGQANTLIAPSN